MARKSAGILGILVIVVLSFMAGYWPEHQKYLNAAGDLRLADKQLAEAMGRQRVYHMENIVLQALDRAAHGENEAAQRLAGEFFMEVRTAIARPDMTQFKPELKEFLDKGDELELALGSKENAAAREMLRGIMQKLARMAGPAPTPSEPPAVVSVSPAPQN